MSADRSRIAVEFASKSQGPKRTPAHPRGPAPHGIERPGAKTSHLRMFVIVTRGQFAVSSIECFLKNWIDTPNIVRVESEGRLLSLAKQLAARTDIQFCDFIVDASAFPDQGNETVRRFCGLHPHARVMFFNKPLSASEAETPRVKIFPQLSLSSSRVKWERILRQLVLSVSSAHAKPIEERRNLRSAENASVLSSRQREVLELVLQGLTNKEIAQRMGVVESTIKRYVGSLMHHFGVYRRTHLMALSKPSLR